MPAYPAPPPAVIADDDAIRGWVERAIDFGITLPPKTAKQAKAKPKR